MNEPTEQERIQQAVESFHQLGREDFVYRKEPRTGRPTPCGNEWSNYDNVEEAIVKSAYEQGRREAEAEMQTLGPVKFYLVELTKILEDAVGNEWYGDDDFDPPKQLVQMALEALDKSEQGA